GLQFRHSKILVLPQFSILYIFTPADDGRVRGQLLQLITQLERVIQRHSKCRSSFPRSQQRTDLIQLIGCDESGDLPFNDCGLNTADAGWLAGTVHIGYGSLLIIIDRDKTLDDRAPEKLGELDVRDKVKSTRQHIALDVRRSHEALDSNALQFRCTVGGRDPRVSIVRNSAKLAPQGDPLDYLRRCSP